jgi:hypothetical protein
MLMKTLASITLSLSLIGTSSAALCLENQEPNSQARIPTVVIQNEQPAPIQMKVLAQGFHSSITNQFVAVVRDAETYKELRKRDGNLPQLDAAFFEANIVVAAFLGERNTGGYAVEITEEASGKIHVAERKPGKGAMVPQMITSPFKIVAITAHPNSRVLLSLDDAWRARSKFYRVNRGSFGFSGGFAGGGEGFELKGTVLVMRAGAFKSERPDGKKATTELVTFSFDLFSSGERAMRSMADSATAVVKSDDRIVMQRMNAGSLVPPPHGGFQSSGTFSEEGRKLLLQLSSLPTEILDGYSGSGRIEAGLVEVAQVSK